MKDQDRPQNRPASPEVAPDPAHDYDRAEPESGAGRLDNNTNATPADHDDRTGNAVGNRQSSDRQINAHDITNDRSHARPIGGPDAATTQPAAPQPDHSMFDEEPMGADQRPQDIHDPAQQRHPRRGGKGGTPDATEPRERG